MTSALDPIHAFHISVDRKMAKNGHFWQKTAILLGKNIDTFIGNDELIIIV